MNSNIRAFLAAALAAAFFGFSAAARADYGWYDDSMAIGNWSGAISSWSGDPANPTDLGILTNLELRTVSFNIWSDANDRKGANVYFQVHDSSGPVGGVQDVWAHPAIPIAGKAHDFAIAYGFPEDLAAGAGLVLEEGREYFLEVWAKSYGDGEDEWYSNGGVNYHAKFRYSATLPPVAMTTGVPFDWLQAKAPNILAENGGDFEAAAADMVANGRDTVRDCYVAGLEPEDPEAAFLAEIDFSSGALAIHCRPEPGEGRALVLEALKSMAETNWTDISLLDDPVREGWRIFRLGIDLAVDEKAERETSYENGQLTFVLYNGKTLTCMFPGNYEIGSRNGMSVALLDGTSAVVFTYQDLSGISQELVDNTIHKMLEDCGEGTPCGDWMMYEHGANLFGVQVYEKQLLIISTNGSSDYLKDFLNGISDLDIK